MKKLLVCLTLLVGVFGFSMGAFSADICSVCTPEKAPDLRHVPVQAAPGQDETVYCHPFDFETGNGYCEDIEDYKAIFSICNCDNPSDNFKEGAVIGIRMTILVNGQAGENGAYWSDASDNTIYFAKYATTDKACKGSDSDFNVDVKFGDVTFYNSELVEKTPLGIKDTDCEVEEDNQTTVLVTDKGTGYTITGDDVINTLSHWWIDIPYIRIDPAVLHNGETISVKIELLNQESGGICAACQCVCDCTIDVAIVGCEDDPQSSGLLFPYFTSLTDTDSWWNGIVIINRTSKDGTATLTAYESADLGGGVGTFTVDVPANSIFAKTLNAIAWQGTIQGNLPCYIEVTTDYADADGFGMMGHQDAGWGNGYLPRLGD